MRKKIAKLLMALAEIICHGEDVKAFLKSDVYEPKQIAFATSYTNKDVRRKCKTYKISRRKAVKSIVEDCKIQNMKVIFGTAKRFLHHKVYNDGNEIVVETRLNTYVRKEK